MKFEVDVFMPIRIRRLVSRVTLIVDLTVNELASVSIAIEILRRRSPIASLVLVRRIWGMSITKWRGTRAVESTHSSV